MGTSFLNKMKSGKVLQFFGDNKSVLGIDIGTSSLKLLQLRREKERAVLETYGELSTGLYHTQESGRALLLQEEKITEMLKDLKKEAGAKASYGVIGIPLRYSFVTLIEMPIMSDRELEESMLYEARRYVPLPSSEVVLEWWKIPFSEQERRQKRGKMSILLAASKKDMVEHYKNALEEAGIKFKGFEIELFSLARAIIGRFRMPVILLDIGAFSVKIGIVDRGSIRMVYSVERGSQAFTLALSQAMGIDFERAEEMKKKIGISSNPEAEGVRRIIMPLLDHIFDEVEKMRSLYLRRHQKTIEKIILSGGGSLMPGLVEYAVKRFGIEVLTATPFDTLEYPTFLQPMIRKVALSFGVAVGLALRGLKDKS